MTPPLQEGCKEACPCISIVQTFSLFSASIRLGPGRLWRQDAAINFFVPLVTTAMCAPGGDGLGQGGGPDEGLVCVIHIVGWQLTRDPVRLLGILPIARRLDYIAQNVKTAHWFSRACIMQVPSGSTEQAKQAPAVLQDAYVYILNLSGPSHIP